MIPINQTPYQTFPSQITGLVQLTIICCGAQVAGTFKKKHSINFRGWRKKTY